MPQMIDGKPVTVILALTEDDAMDLTNLLLRQFVPRQTEEAARVRIGERLQRLMDHFP